MQLLQIIQVRTFEKVHEDSDRDYWMKADEAKDIWYD